MALKISGTDVVDNNKKGLFQSINFGSYTNATRPSSPSVGDVIYNSDESTIQVWDGSSWV